MGSAAKASKVWPWLVVLGCIGFYSIPTALIGNTAGLFVAPVMDEFGWSQTDTTMYRTIQPLVSAVTCPIAAKLLAKYDGRWILAAVTLLFGLASVWSSFATTLVEWNIYGVIYGITAGFFMYLATPVILNNWFKKGYGVAIAITAAALSVIGAIASPIVQAMITESGWQTARLMLSIFTTVLGTLLCVLFVRKSPAVMGLLAFGEGEGEEPSSGRAASSDPEEGAEVAAARRSPAYYTLILVAVIFVMCAAFFQQIPAYCTRSALGAGAGAMAVSIMMVGGVIFKLVLGALNDVIGIKWTGVISALGGAAGIAMAFAAGSAGNLTLFYAGMVVFGAGYAGLTVIAPTLARTAFGSKNYSELYSWVTTAIFLGTAACFTIFGMIYDTTGAYDLCFLLVIALYLIAAVLVPFTVKVGQRTWKS
ncbi:MAG: MFS transporter [Coriobacteriales bacterium]